jgi:hypothetical protein
MSRPVNRWWLGLAAGLLHLVACFLVFIPDPYTGGDNAAYLALAHSLLEGRYVDIWDPALPRHGQYPPVFPAILALAWVAGLQSFVALKIVIVVASAIAVGCATAWAAGAFGLTVGALTGLFLALMPGTLERSHWVLSDVPFWTFTALALLALTERDRLRRADCQSPEAEVPRRRRPGAAAVWGGTAVLAALAAFFTRSAGLPLFLAAGVHLALRRYCALLAAGAAAVVPAGVAWWIFSASAGAAYNTAFMFVDPYRPELGTIGMLDLIGRVADNTVRYGSRHLPSFLTGSQSGLAVVATLGLLAAGLAAGIVTTRRGNTTRTALAGTGLHSGYIAILMFLFPYTGLVLIWPATWSGERFLLPVVPVVLAYAVHAVLLLATQMRMPHALAAAGVALIVLVVVTPSLVTRSADALFCRSEGRHGVRLPCTTAPWRDLLLLADDLRGRMPDDAVIISRKPTLVYSLSGYASRVFPLSPDPAVFFDAARDANAEWVILDQSELSAMYLHPVLLAARDEFCVMAAPIRPEAVLLRLDPGGPARDPAAASNAFRPCTGVLRP